MPLGHSLWQTVSMSGDDQRLGAKMCRAVGNINPVPVREHPVRNDQPVGDGLKASGRGASRGDGINSVALSAQELGHD